MKTEKFYGVLMISSFNDDASLMFDHTGGPALFLYRRRAEHFKKQRPSAFKIKICRVDVSYEVPPK